MNIRIQVSVGNETLTQRCIMSEWQARKEMARAKATLEHLRQMPISLLSEPMIKLAEKNAEKATARVERIKKACGCFFCKMN